MNRASRNILYALAFLVASTLQASAAEICEVELPVDYSFKKKPAGFALARIRQCARLSCEHEQDGIDFGMKCMDPQVLQEGSVKDGIEGNPFWAEFYSDLAPRWLGGQTEGQKCDATLSKINQLSKDTALIRIVAQDVRGEIDEERILTFRGCSRFEINFGPTCSDFVKLVKKGSEIKSELDVIECLEASPKDL